MARKTARRVAKERIKQIARDSAEFATVPFLISPVTRPFATPIRRIFPETVDVLVESGALDDAIDAKVNELALERGLTDSLRARQMQEQGISQTEALLATAKQLGTDPEIVKEIENLIVASGGEKLVQTGREVIRKSRQFDLQNLLPRFVETRPRKRRKTKTDKNMSKALAQANKELRKKNGQLRKGVTQGDIMRRAHRIRRKMS